MSEKNQEVAKQMPDINTIDIKKISAPLTDQPEQTKPVAEQAQPPKKDFLAGITAQLLELTSEESQDALETIEAARKEFRDGPEAALIAWDEAPKLTNLPIDIARLLTEHFPGNPCNLDLNGLMYLEDGVAHVLSSWPGNIFLNGLRYITPDEAASFTQQLGASISLRGLVKIDDRVAEGFVMEPFKISEMIIDGPQTMFTMNAFVRLSDCGYRVTVDSALQRFISGELKSSWSLEERKEYIRAYIAKYPEEHLERFFTDYIAGARENGKPPEAPGNTTGKMKADPGMKLHVNKPD